MENKYALLGLVWCGGKLIWFCKCWRLVFCMEAGWVLINSMCHCCPLDTPTQSNTLTIFFTSEKKWPTHENRSKTALYSRKKACKNSNPFLKRLQLCDAACIDNVKYMY